jgi:hypothetical protein
LGKFLYRFLLKVYPPFFGGQFSVNSLLHQGSGSQKIAGVVMPPPSTQAKKSSTSHWDGEAFVKAG